MKNTLDAYVIQIDNKGYYDRKYELVIPNILEATLYSSINSAKEEINSLLSYYNNLEIRKILITNKGII